MRTSFLDSLSDEEAAALDPKQIFFWQLVAEKHISKQLIGEIVTDFYKLVWALDDKDALKKSFTDLVTFEHAVWAQTMMWIDALGGGKAYHGEF